MRAHRALVVSMLVSVLAACGATAAPPVEVAGDPVPSRARCGELTEANLGEQPVSLLADHLRMRVVEGLVADARRASIMAAPEPRRESGRAPRGDRSWMGEPPQGETFLALDGSAPRHGLVVIATEVFRSAGDDLVASTDDFLHDVPHRTTLLPVAAPLRATLVRPVLSDGSDDGAPADEGDLLMIARVLVASDDGTVQHIAFAAGADIAATDADREGCAALARVMAETVSAGDRRVDLRARTVAIGDGLVVDVPDGYALLPQPGPDFSVSYFYRVVPLGSSHAQIGFYLGGHASSHAHDVTDLHEEPGQLFAASVPFRVWTTPNDHHGRTHHQEAIADVPSTDGLVAHVFFVAEDEARVAELRAIAQSLRRESP